MSNRRRRDKKRDKRKRKQKKNGHKPPAPRKAATTNGQLIQDLMTSREVRGSYKDYVVIAGNRLVDWIDSWEIYRPDGEPYGLEGVALIHKSKLHETIDHKFAEKFWHPKFGRVPPTQAARNPNAARAE